MTAALRGTPPGSACELHRVSGIVSAMGERQTHLPAATPGASPEDAGSPRLRLVSPDRVVEIELDAHRNGIHSHGEETSLLDPAEAAALLPQARAMLAVLHADRAMIEARLGSLGRTDPIREVTGRSALDAAIAEASELVAELEAVCRHG
jgi:hypothetical protein